MPREIRIQESPFHQMLVNLIKNSIEAIDELAASGGLSEAPRIQFRAYIEDDFLCLDITDNGIGIDPEDISKIFFGGVYDQKRGEWTGFTFECEFCDWFWRENPSP